MQRVSSNFGFICSGIFKYLGIEGMGSCIHQSKLGSRRPLYKWYKNFYTSNTPGNSPNICVSPACLDQSKHERFEAASL